MPFDGEGPGEIFSAVLETTPTPLRTLRPELPQAWGDVVARCMNRSVHARYQSVAELARAVAPLGSGRWAHLLGAIESALALSPQNMPLPDVSLMEAAVAAAATSLAPPGLPAPPAPPAAYPTFVTGKTLGAEVVSLRYDRPRPRRRFAAWAASGAAVAGLLLTVLAASATHVARSAPALAARTAGETSPAIISPRDEPQRDPAAVLAPPAEPAVIAPADASPPPSASPASPPPPVRSARSPRPATPPSPKTGATPTRPKFLKSWR